MDLDSEESLNTESEGENSDESDQEDESVTNDDLKQQIEKEEKLANAFNFEDANQSQDLKHKKILKYYRHWMDISIYPSYEDITNMFIDGNIFVVCGDSLILSMMGNPSYNSDHGGQMLHLIYLCERILQLFSRKGGTFEIVFFNIWKDTFNGNHNISLARSTLLSHFQNNTSIEVHQFYAIWDDNFQKYLNSHRPTFLLVDLNLLEAYKRVSPGASIDVIDLAFHSQVLFSVAYNLSCVDLCDVVLDVSTLHAFVVAGIPSLKGHLLRTLSYLKAVMNGDIQQLNDQNKPLQMEIQAENFKTNEDVRHMVAVTAAAWYLTEENVMEDWVRVFLLYSAVMQVMPLRHRGCPRTTLKGSETLSLFIGKIQGHMNRALNCISGPDYVWVNVSDIWHGNLFVRVLYHLRQIDVSQDLTQIGSQIGEVYKKLACDVAKLIKRDLDILPLQESSLSWFDGSEDAEGVNELIPSTLSQDIVARLVPTSCQLTREFCKDALSDMLLQANKYDDRIRLFLTREQHFTETQHWHSDKPLTDEQDRIHCDQIRTLTGSDKYWYLKNRQLMSRFMKFYGSNVEGRHLKSKVIVSRSENSCGTKKKSSCKKETKKTKMSKNALKIIEGNQIAKQDSLKEIDGKKYTYFKDTYKVLKQKGEYWEALSQVKRLLGNVQSAEYIQKALLYNAEICYALWSEECRAKKKSYDRDLNFAKELMLCLRGLLKQINLLTDADKKRIGLWLCRLGFSNIAKALGLPQPEREDDMFQVGMSSIRFQLLHLGPELDRCNEGQNDTRVDFTPDPWQKELLDIIDRRQSAVIVAPTSSGKTYASYYCMESVLREDDEGVVVYVSPTKALVNQVAATVCARFSKQMPEGKSVYGVFTRDYRTDDMNCQILITVPQCLEILLLSPRRYSWVQKLRYVIFDEIHCLAGQAGGISWECGLLLIRCPFLALSATIEKPEVLHNWLQSAQDFKRQRDDVDGCARKATSYKVHLVVHKERHNDLKKFVYKGDGSILHVHPCAHVDDTVIKEHNGIPSHITLSPEETLQLYMAMHSVSSEDMIKLEPELYFEKYNFVTRPAVREYERNLKSVLQSWALNNEDSYNSVLAQLNSQLANNDECGLRFITLNFVALVQNLQKANMLPAIVFWYDKSMIDLLFSKFVVYCVSLEKEDAAKQERKEKNNELSDRKGKELKSMCKNVGQSSTVMGDASRFGDGSLKKRYKQVEVNPRSLGLLERTSTGSIRNIGTVDEDDIKMIEKRLLKAGCKRKDTFPSGLRMGLGKHHSALGTKERSAVEMLFRMKVLNLVLATGTLALGVHMPCKTVVIAGDSNYLNSLEFHQMSGRAGRRGFDTSGNVVFYGLGERKSRILLTGKLPVMIGNFPLSVSMVLRFLLLVSDVTNKGVPDGKATQDSISRALAYLNCNLVYQSFPELKAQMKHFFAFSTQLLMLQGLIDTEGNPQSLTGLLTHIHYHEPGNLVFMYLLRSGALQELCQPNDETISKKDRELKLILVLSYLFAPLPLHVSVTSVEFSNSVVILPPLPPEIVKKVRMYNEEVKFVYDNYFQCVAKHYDETMGEDNTLPLSNVCINPATPFVPDTQVVNLGTAIVQENVPRKICSAFAALSGHSDRGLYSQRNVISNIRHQVFTDVKVVPVLDWKKKLNAYAYDFYNHGIANAIEKDNGIRGGDCFNILKDFMLVLQAICTSLGELDDESEDPLLEAFRSVTEKFTTLFQKAYFKGGKYSFN